MVSECPQNSTLEVCDLLSESGIGIGTFIEELRSPLGQFILVFAVIAGIAGLISGFIFLIRRTASRNL